MTTDPEVTTVRGVRVSVVRKEIKNLHLGVYPPDGHVRIAVPLAVSDSAVRAAIAGKLPWIRRQQVSFERQARESPREMVNGESHWYLGRRYRLRVAEVPGRSRVKLLNRSTMELTCRPGADARERAAVLERWYRGRLREFAGPMLDAFALVVGVEVADWRIKRMKTKWGSCNARDRRIWLNLELAKKPAACVEYIVVHELAHLVERRHDRRFQLLLDEHLPRWRFLRAELGVLPLADDSWAA
jgi:predicted metal-dependent hydrolase